MLRKKRLEKAMTNETISIRAYQLWQARGCPEGEDGGADWQAAKDQLVDEAGRRKPLRRLWARLRNRAA